MFRYFLILVSVYSFCIVNGETTHHFRHHGLLTQALRERLGLPPLESAQNNVEDSQQMMLLPEISKVLSNLHQRREEIVNRFNPLSMAGIMMGGMTDNQKQLEQPEVLEDKTNTDEDAYKRIITVALNHVMKNLQTVEGGQEAARWILNLRNGMYAPMKPSPNREEISTTETTEKISLATTSTSTTTSLPINLNVIEDEK